MSPSYLVTVLVVLGSLADADMRFPLFYLTPHAAPAHLMERVAVVPKPLTGGDSPLITNRVSYSVDPDDASSESYEVSQFHTQDAKGRFIYGFHSPDQVRMESRNSDGSVSGSYSYIDPFGMTIKMQYWDDGEGFHTSGNALPVAYLEPPQYTPEVQAAREEHFRLYEMALRASEAVADQEEEDEREAMEEAEVPQEVEDTEGETVVVGESYMGRPQDEGEEDEDSVAVDNPQLTEEDAVLTKFWQRRGRSRQLPPPQPANSEEVRRDGLGGFYYHYQHYIPVAIKMEDPVREETSESYSAMAVRAGGIPVAAVHDAQVSPKQRGDSADSHQFLPVIAQKSLPA